MPRARTKAEIPPRVHTFIEKTCYDRVRLCAAARGQGVAAFVREALDRATDCDIKAGVVDRVVQAVK
jgi:hypothetical protein